MPNSNTHRRGHDEKNRRSKLPERASSFHGQIPVTTAEKELIRRRTVPDMLSGRSLGGVSATAPPLKLTKLLLNVTIQRSPGAVHVVMSPESTVGDLIAAALREYAKEGRRPILTSIDSSFDLHYSQFSLESIDRDEMLMALGSRNFFLCPNNSTFAVGSSSGSGNGGASNGATASSCSKQAEKSNKMGIPYRETPFSAFNLQFF